MYNTYFWCFKQFEQQSGDKNHQNTGFLWGFAAAPCNCSNLLAAAVRLQITIIKIGTLGLGFLSFHAKVLNLTPLCQGLLLGATVQ